MDFGELKNDKNFVNKVNRINSSLDNVEKYLQTALGYNEYDKLTTQEQVKIDLYLSYTINSLYWMYIKLQGLDPNSHDIKNELSRVRQNMLREKQIHERNTIRPVLDKSAAGRFIKHGLHDRSGRKLDNENNNKNVEKQNQQKNSNDNNNENNDDDGPPLNKRIKFDDASD